MSEFNDNEVLYYENKLDDEENKPLFKVSTLDDNGKEDENARVFHKKEEENIYEDEDNFSSAFSEELLKDDKEEAQENSKIPELEELQDKQEFQLYKENALENFQSKENVSLKNRVFELIESYQNLKEEYEALENKFSAVKTQNEVLQAQLARVEKEVIYKTTNEDDIIKQIEAVLKK